MTTQTPITDALLAQWYADEVTTQDVHDLARTLESELAEKTIRADANYAMYTKAQAEAATLRAALEAVMPLMDSWLNGDGTNIDMNEWDAATMLGNATLAKVQS